MGGDDEGLVRVLLLPLTALVRRALFLPFLPRLGFFGVSLALLPSAGASTLCLPLSLSKIAPTVSSPEAKLVAMSNSSFALEGGFRPSSCTMSLHVVPR